MLAGADVLRSFEHHVFEEMREPSPTAALVSRAHIVINGDRDHRGVMIFDSDHAQAILEGCFLKVHANVSRRLRLQLESKRAYEQNRRKLEGISHKATPFSRQHNFGLMNVRSRAFQPPMNVSECCSVVRAKACNQTIGETNWLLDDADFMPQVRGLSSSRIEAIGRVHPGSREQLGTGSAGVPVIS